MSKITSVTIFSKLYIPTVKTKKISSSSQLSKFVVQSKQQKWMNYQNYSILKHKLTD